MNTIINRLSELSDALHEKSLHPEAELVRTHISLLASEEYHDVIENEGLEAVLIDLTNDF